MSNFLLDTDSYKHSHYRVYKEDVNSVFSYIESRGGRFKDIVFFGLQKWLKELKPITMEDVEAAREACEDQMIPFNYDGWKYIVEKHNGYLPILIKAAPEGTVVPVHNALVTVVNTDPKCPWLTSFIETSLLRAVWYPSTVATLSREMKRIILKYLEETGTPEDIIYKLHDFGARGVSSKESASIGGLAHLINFHGSDTMSAIECSREFYNFRKPSTSVPACYDEKTEILTQDGFKFFKDLTENDVVAQYTKNGELEFVKPTQILKYKFIGDMYNFYTTGNVSKVDLLVTPNHKMVVKKDNNICLNEAETVNYNFSNKFIFGGSYINKNSLNSKLSFYDRLRIAFQADGSFASHKDDYNGNASQTIPIRFSLKKERKQKRLEWILDNIGLKYQVYNGIGSHSGYKSYWIPVPLSEKFSKIFDWIDILQIDNNWCKEFVDEVKNWDATERHNTIVYSSTIKKNVDMLDVISILGGFKSSSNVYIDKRKNRVPIYTLNISSKIERKGKGIIKESKSYDGMVYCVSVPSKMIVVRRNKCVMVCGNCEHSVSEQYGEYGETDYIMNMVNSYGGENAIYSIVGDTYNIFEFTKKIAAFKDKIISKGGRCVIRPDSGDMIEVCLKIMEILWNGVGGTVNSKGYKVLDPHFGILQGDGINIDSLEPILKAFKEHGYSTDNIGFGCGGGLLQSVNRDTCKWAMKASAIRYDKDRNGNVDIWYGISKHPITDPGKKSKEGILSLFIENGEYKTLDTLKIVDNKTELKIFMPMDKQGMMPELYRNKNLTEVLRPVYMNGEILVDDSLPSIRERATLNGF